MSDERSWSDFLVAEVKELQSQPDIESKQTKNELNHERLKQAHKLRTPFFWLASGLAGASVVAGIVVVIWYLVVAGAEVSPVVLVSFFTSVVVETLGILYIIARYLYPPKRRKRK